MFLSHVYDNLLEISVCVQLQKLHIIHKFNNTICLGKKESVHNCSAWHNNPPTTWENIQLGELIQFLKRLLYSSNMVLTHNKHIHDAPHPQKIKLFLIACTNSGN
jgi:hypothetical protein